MKSYYSLSVLLPAAALLAFSMPVSAFPEMKPCGEGHGPMMESGHMEGAGEMMGACTEHAKQMGLTDDQILKIKPMHHEMQKKQARFGADMKIAEIELIEIMEVKDFDMEKAVSAEKKIAEIKTAHNLEMLKAMKEVRSIMTDEQFAKMKTMTPKPMAEKKPHKKIMKKHHEGHGEKAP